MLAGPENPRSGHLDSDTKGIGGKWFYDRDSAAVTDVSVQESAKTDKALR